MITTRELFNDWLPAFRTPGPEVFNKMATDIEELEQQWYDLLRPTYAPTREEELLIARAATTRTAYRIVPSLDLVLTPTGFGIVSNQNTAPASRERVAALREQLRHQASHHEESMLQHFVSRQAYDKPELLVRSLFWCPSLATTYGLTTPTGQQIFMEDLQALDTPITIAQAKVANVISPELMATLIAHQYAPETAPDRHSLLIALTDLARKTMASLIAHEPPHVAQMLFRLLLLEVQEHMTALPEYANSATCQAQHLKPYENKKDDPSFFFA